MLRLSRLIGSGFLLVCVLTFVAKLNGLPVGNGLVNLGIGPAVVPVELTFWYSTEKQQWLNEAAKRFTATNPTVNGQPITVNLVGLGSREMALRVAAQEWGSDAAPTVISPASTLQVGLLEREWAAKNGGTVVATGGNGPQPLVLTPLVVVAWEERAKALWPNGPPAQAFWQDIHDALVDPKGWQGRGGLPQWGVVKFGHTSPATSNSGEQALVLLAYGYYNKTSGLSEGDIRNPEFQTWLRDVERSVPEFGDSTGTFMASMVQYGPSKYDMVAVYENVALQQIGTAQERWNQALRIYYPPATLISEHPYVTLEAPWVAPEQQQAARVLRDFLLSEPIQRLALESGFRPVNSAVSINDDVANNPFISEVASGVKADLGNLIEIPPAAVVAELQQLWQTIIN